MTKKTANRHKGFTLVELLVVIAIIIVIAALAAAFAPRVNDSTNLTRAVDNLEQWLLTAKMRAKRDGVATGVRFIQAQGEPNVYSQLQYIQQPDPLSGSPGGPTLQSVSSGIATFVTGSIDFTLGGANLTQTLVEGGDYLEVRGGGVCYIQNATSATTLQLAGTYSTSLSITTATTNFRILRQPRILIGEETLTLPNNFAINFTTLPGTSSPGCNVLPNASGLYYEILFSPRGAVIGSNAGNGKVLISVYDQTMTPFDINRVGIVAVQCHTGFIGAYSVAPGADPFLFAEQGSESGL